MVFYGCIIPYPNTDLKVEPKAWYGKKMYQLLERWKIQVILTEILRIESTENKFSKWNASYIPSFFLQLLQKTKHYDINKL
jgi:hypothetical protein